jgi:hypothetical protein
MKRLAILLFLGFLLPANAQPPAEPKPKDAPAAPDPAAVAPTELPVVFYQDFRGKPLPKQVSLAASQAEAVCEVEPEGLRITISKKTTTFPPGGVGIKANIALKGDFETTASVEILKAEPPQAGAGVGVGLFVATSTKTADVSINRVILPNGRQVLMNWWRGQKNKNYAPCTETTLRLRLRRIGDEMYYLWSPALTGDDFQLAGKTTLGPKDVEFVRLTAITDQKSYDIDVRWLDLEIRGQKNTEPIDRSKSWSNTPAPGTTFVAKNADGKGSLAVIALVIGLVVTIVACVGCWLYLRKRS